ncbi:MAG TPA: DUF2069 domain-containing protein [Gammaproteobacteria bacterium]
MNERTHHALKREWLARTNAVLAILLALLYVAWWLSAGMPVKALPLAAILAAVVPLLLLVPSLWKARRFGGTLAGFILPFHFAFAVMELVANADARAWVAVQTFLSLLLMTGVMATLRQVRPQREPASS